MQLPSWSSQAIDCADNFRNHGGNSEFFMTGGAKQVACTVARCATQFPQRRFQKKAPRTL